jgi:hypothetical protein
MKTQPQTLFEYKHIKLVAQMWYFEKWLICSTLRVRQRVKLNKETE